MSRHPKVLIACLAVARAERGAAKGYAERRAALAAGADPRTAEHGDGVVVEQHDVPVEGGSVRATVYRSPVTGPQPAHVLLHGGGFCYGGSQEVDQVAREYALRAGCTVVSVDYRLSPEVRWPVPAEDVYTALCWTSEHHELLGLDASRLSIGGVSAGGCLAATVAIMARDRGGPALNFQLLEIPVLDIVQDFGTTMQRYATGNLLTRAHLAECYAHYVPDPADRAAASPFRAEDLRGLPPTLVVTAEHDPLRDEGEEYGRRLRAAGVPVQVIRASGHVHSSTYSALPSAVRYRAAAAAVLARAHRVPTAG